MAENQPHNLHGRAYKNIVPAMRHALSSGLRAAIYSIPRSKSLRWICGDEPRLSIRRLVAVDFARPYSSGIAIYDGLTPDEALRATGTAKTTATICTDSTDEALYMADIERLKCIVARSNGKAVLSRIICGQSQALAKDTVAVALDYFKNTPNNFNILLHTPETGTWIVSTPERLLDMKLDSGRISTMALAGTMPTPADGLCQWDIKNIREQAIVSDEIIRQLNKAHVQNIRNYTCNVASGAVTHICTHIYGTTASPNAYRELLDILSPTPALGGWPRHTALQLIRKFEKHPRQLYGGYISIEDDKTAQAFVTLRCAHTDNQGRYCIYTGSGILSNSDAESERNETALKASGLLRSILNSI
ncbi:MAG: chorismate-binding protein [Bacteroidales bacterium]|nr:chorismate-binding protein [Bacteroidales bacterium]